MSVTLRTFGCRANHYDAEQVRAMVERAGIAVGEAPGARLQPASAARRTS